MNAVVADDSIEDIAAQWVLRLDRGELSPTEELELDAWLESDTRHRGAFVRAQAIWHDLNRVAVLSAGGTAVPAPVPVKHAAMLRAASVAAVMVALAFTAIGISSHYLDGRESTDVGEIRRMMLADGSAVALNTASVVQVKFDEDVRRIVLREGEASFRVVHDETRPFIVEAGEVWVRAVGTAFTVRLRADSVEVTVTEGIVAVARPDHSSAVAAPQTVGRNEEAIAAASQSIATAPLSDGEVARRLAWHQGRLIFDGERLATAVAEVNRYSEKPVVIDDALLRDRSLVGVFQAGDARGFAHAAAAAFDARVREADDAFHLEK